MTTLTSTGSTSPALHHSGFLHRLAKPLLLKMIAGLRYGSITIKEDDQSRTFGTDSSLHATITIHDPAAYARILIGGSIGAGESYIDGLWEADNLTSLVRIIVLNMEVLDDIEAKMAWFLRPLRRIQHVFKNNSRKGSKENILAHYDLGNELYKSFLDPTMMYSSAIYPEPSSSLEEASLYKLDYICRKLKLNELDRVIEIGSGWGGFALHAATHYGCHVTTTTISEAQYQEAQKRIDEAGLSKQITLLKQDYRDLEGQYDKLVSIEMIEAVGYKYLPVFFEKCGSLLKSGGMMLLQAITIQDQKYSRYINDVDFIQKHIFPGGCLTSNSHMLSMITQKTDMVVRSIEDFGFDYAKTLKEWRHRFLASFSKIESQGYDQRFKRLWEFYLSYCEGGFQERSISVVQLVASKPHNRVSVVQS